MVMGLHARYSARCYRHEINKGIRIIVADLICMGPALWTMSYEVVPPRRLIDATAMIF